MTVQVNYFPSLSSVSFIISHLATTPDFGSVYSEEATQKNMLRLCLCLLCLYVLDARRAEE